MSTGIGGWEIQKAIYGRLTGDSTLMALVTGVYDAVPEGSVFPYVTVGDNQELPFRVFGGTGHECYPTLHVWTQDEAAGKVGYNEGLAIASRLNVLLDTYNLSVAGHTTVTCQFQDYQTLIEQDGITRHIPITYQVIVQ